MAERFTPEDRARARKMRELAHDWSGEQVAKGVDASVPAGRVGGSDYNQHAPFLEADGSDLDEYYARANKIMGITTA